MFIIVKIVSTAYRYLSSLLSAHFFVKNICPDLKIKLKLSHKKRNNFKFCCETIEISLIAAVHFAVFGTHTSQ